MITISEGIYTKNFGTDKRKNNAQQRRRGIFFLPFRPKECIKSERHTNEMKHNNLQQTKLERKTFHNDWIIFSSFSIYEIKMV